MKHRLGSNSVKMYDKCRRESARIETTIHQAEGLKVYRPKESDPEKTLAWQSLRRSVADLYRRCELSRKANEAYLEALAVVESPETLGSLVAPVSGPLEKAGRRYRGLNLLAAPDRRLLKAINRGEYAASIAAPRPRRLDQRELRIIAHTETTSETRRPPQPRRTRRAAASVSSVVRRRARQAVAAIEITQDPGQQACSAVRSSPCRRAEPLRAAQLLQHPSRSRRQPFAPTQGKKTSATPCRSATTTSVGSRQSADPDRRPGTAWAP